jgi:hypothetical protein
MVKVLELRCVDWLGTLGLIASVFFGAIGGDHVVEKIGIVIAEPAIFMDIDRN